MAVYTDQSVYVATDLEFYHFTLLIFQVKCSSSFTLLNYSYRQNRLFQKNFVFGGLFVRNIVAS